MGSTIKQSVMMVEDDEFTRLTVKAERPAESHYLIKHSVTKIAVLIEEIKEAIKSAPTT